MNSLFEIMVSNAVVAGALALVMAGIGRLLRRPVLMHFLWVVVLLKLVTPPVFPVQIPVDVTMANRAALPSATALRRLTSDDTLFDVQPVTVFDAEEAGVFAGPAADHQPPPVGLADPEPGDRVPSGLNVAALVAACWLLGAAAVLGITSLRVYRFKRALRFGEAAPRSLQREVTRLSAWIGLPRSPQVVLLSATVSPMVWAPFARPKLLFPVQLLNDLEPESLRALLLHELSHLKRRDHWVRILELAATALYWWYPVLWWVRREIRVVEEECCDAWVVSELPDSRAAYATGLAQTVGFLSQRHLGSPPAACGIDGFGNLQHRVRAIMTGSQPRQLSRATRVGVTSLAGLLLLALPTIGQPTDSDESEQRSGQTRISSDAAPAPDQSGDRIRVSGHALDRHGQPVAGTTVSAVIQYADPIKESSPDPIQTTPRADGSFVISIPKSLLHPQVGAQRAGDLVKTTIVARAPNHGPDWFDLHSGSTTENVTLHMAKDDVPLSGRVVDLQGQPIAGVSVTVQHLWKGSPEDMGKFFAFLDSKPHFNSIFRWLSEPLHDRALGSMRVTTDASGSFRLPGIGRDRVARLKFEGPAIVSTVRHAVTRPMAAVRLPGIRIQETLFGATIDHVAEPTQLIVGTVKDAETGQPLVGAEIRSLTLAGSRRLTPELIRTTTDEQGRYRLKGMPKAEGNSIEVVPTGDQPYFARPKSVPTRTGMEPVTVDFRLSRGKWISGRALDKSSGKPLLGRVIYMPFLTNKNIARYPASIGTLTRFRTKPDGSFRIVGLPGRALVGLLPDSGYYRKTGASSKLRSVRNPLPLPGRLTLPRLVAEIDVSSDGEPPRCNIEAEPAAAVQVSVVDPDNQSLAGFQVVGRQPHETRFGTASATDHFEVLDLQPNEARHLVIRHGDRKLGLVKTMRAGEPGSENDIRVKLLRFGSATGRITDDEGRPQPDVKLVASPAGLTNQRLGPPIQASLVATTDAEGRFRFDQLLPNGVYAIKSAPPANPASPRIVMLRRKPLANKVTTRPGEQIDLGDIVFGDRQ